MTKPNIVLIMTDQQSFDMVGVLDSRNPSHTPNIDALGQQGVVFDRAYTASPVCTPSRASLFTGMYPHRTGAFANGMALAQNVKHMGQVMTDHGYKTAYFGKWHLDGAGYFGSGEAPDGWSEPDWYDGARYIEDIGPAAFSLRRTLHDTASLRENSIDRMFTWAGRNTDRAIDFMKQENESGQPVLMVVSYDEPHAPYVCPAPFAEKFLDYDFQVGPAAFDDLASKPQSHQAWAREISDIPSTEKYPLGSWAEQLENVRRTGALRKPMQFGCNAFVDSEIGILIDAVHRELGENTVIFYTADHGDMNGAHRLLGKGPAMYEQITRVPLIVNSLDGRFDSGHRSDEVGNIDILPTMLSLAHDDKHQYADQLDGSDLVPLLHDRSTSRETGALIQFHRFEIYQEGVGGWQPIRALVKNGWKLVVNLNYEDELYDLNSDPHELHNLISSQDAAPVLRLLHQELSARMQTSLDWLRGVEWYNRYREISEATVPKDWSHWRPVPTVGQAPGPTSI